MEKLLTLNSVGELEHKQVEELIYNHYDKPQVPYTKLHYLIGIIHDYQYKKVNSNKKKCNEWLKQYGIEYNGFLYSSDYVTEEEFKDYVVLELSKNEKNITLSKYKEIMNKIGR